MTRWYTGKSHGGSSTIPYVMTTMMIIDQSPKCNLTILLKTRAKVISAVCCTELRWASPDCWKLRVKAKSLALYDQQLHIMCIGIERSKVDLPHSHSLPRDQALSFRHKRAHVTFQACPKWATRSIPNTRAAFQLFLDVAHSGQHVLAPLIPHFLLCTSYCRCKFELWKLHGKLLLFYATQNLAKLLWRFSYEILGSFPLSTSTYNLHLPKPKMVLLIIVFVSFVGLGNDVCRILRSSILYQ